MAFLRALAYILAGGMVLLGLQVTYDRQPAIGLGIAAGSAVTIVALVRSARNEMTLRATALLICGFAVMFGVGVASVTLYEAISARLECQRKIKERNLLYPRPSDCVNHNPIPRDRDGDELAISAGFAIFGAVNAAAIALSRARRT